MTRFTLLLVEDNYGDQKLVAKALQAGNRDTNLQIVCNGDEVVSYLSNDGKYKGAPPPHLIVLDLNLPGKSGFEILAELKQDPTWSNIPVVILTGARVSAEKVAADFYMVKPGELQKYFDVVIAIDQYGRNMLASPESRIEHLQKLRGSV